MNAILRICILSLALFGYLSSYSANGQTKRSDADSDYKTTEKAVKSSSAEAKQQTDESKARRWKVMVIVPEQHLTVPHIPDPAVETTLIKQLIDAGYKVVDQQRIADLRYQAVIDRIIAGGPKAAKEAIQLGRKFGADVLITGQAFTQEVTREQVTTELGTVLRIRCRSRVELKGIRMDSGETFYSDKIQKTGAPDATVELSSKGCLDESAEAMSEGLLAKLDKLSLGTGQHIELQVRGLSSVTLGNALEKALSKMPGVREVSPGSFDGGVYDTEVLLDKKSLSDFAANLESAPSLKRFKLKVQSSNNSRIIVNAK